MGSSVHVPSRRSVITTASLGLLAVVTIAPLLLEPQPVDFLPAYTTTLGTILSMAGVLFLMAVALTVRAELDQPREPHAARNIILFAVLAGLMTLIHWIVVDSRYPADWWEPKTYSEILNHTSEAPHNYRPLPYGFARLVERITHNWTFACVSYRWFFTFWFLWASYRLARLYLSPQRALLDPGAISASLSGVDLPLLGPVDRPAQPRPVRVGVPLSVGGSSGGTGRGAGLGVAAKETVVIVAPAYLACYWRRGWRSWFITAGLGAACVAAFLATRVPLGWRPGSYDKINGTTGLMIGTNLGFGEPIANLVPSLLENYLHPLVFVGLFIPPIVWRWRSLDPHLRALFLVVTPLLLLSNVCFGWLYESRNYMPLVPLLATMAMPPGGDGDSIGAGGTPQGRHVTDEHAGNQAARMRTVGDAAAGEEVNQRRHAQEKPDHHNDDVDSGRCASRVRAESVPSSRCSRIDHTPRRTCRRKHG